MAKPIVMTGQSDDGRHWAWVKLWDGGWIEGDGDTPALALADAHRRRYEHEREFPPPYGRSREPQGEGGDTA